MPQLPAQNEALLKQHHCTLVVALKPRPFSQVVERKRDLDFEPEFSGQRQTLFEVRSCTVIVASIEGDTSQSVEDFSNAFSFPDFPAKSDAFFSQGHRPFGLALVPRHVT